MYRNKDHRKIQSAALNRIRRAREREEKAKARAAQESRTSIPQDSSEYDEVLASFDEAMAELDEELRIHEQLDILQNAIVLAEATLNVHTIYSRQDVGERVVSLEKMV